MCCVREAAKNIFLVARSLRVGVKATKKKDLFVEKNVPKVTKLERGGM